MEPIENVEKLVFYSIGDWGTPGAEILNVAAAMDKYANTIAKPRFILALGDNFYPSGNLTLVSGTQSIYNDINLLRRGQLNFQ